MSPGWLARRQARTNSRSPRSSFIESTLAQLGWERKRRAVARWGWAGLVCGALLALVVFAPATLLAEAVANATGQRLLLADARGTVWNGSAVPVLGGGGDSRSAAILPGRIGWTAGLRGLGIELRLRQDCCIAEELVLLARPGLGRMQLQLLGRSGTLGEWPLAWLAGLGAPWNTLQLGGTLRLSSPGLSLQSAEGRWRLDGQADLEAGDLSSRLSTLDRLGSYRLRITGAESAGPAVNLSTLDGALLLSGNGQWTGSQLRFRGEARAAPGFEGALDNLLNILGRRQGVLSIISIG